MILEKIFFFDDDATALRRAAIHKHVIPLMSNTSHTACVLELHRSDSADSIDQWIHQSVGSVISGVANPCDKGLFQLLSQCFSITFWGFSGVFSVWETLMRI